MDGERSTRPTHHFQYIDALRGVAVLMVIAVHVSLATLVPGLFGKVLLGGVTGVELFYVLSSLTLMMSMKKRTISEERPLLNYFLRRFFRIAPAFYLVFFLYVVLGSGIVSGSPVSRTSFPHALLILSFSNGWSPEAINSPVIGQWSIAVEMMFYLLLPLIFPLIRTFQQAVCAWWLSLILYAISSPLAIQLAKLEGFEGPAERLHDFSHWWLPSHLPTFMAGIGLYYILSKKLPLLRSLLQYVPGVALILILHHLYPEAGKVPLVSLTMVALVGGLARVKIRMVVNRFTRFVGSISFSAYLCHPFLLPLAASPFLFRAVPNPYARFAIGYLIVLALVCPLSYLMVICIEKPGQQIGRLLIRRLSQSHSILVPALVEEEVAKL